MSSTLSPVPDKSPITDKGFKVTLDWVRWFRDVTIFITRLLNRYETQKSGLATLTAGTVVVVNTNVTATSYIRLTRQIAGGILGHLSVVPNVGVGFTINSSAAETSTILYEIVEAF